MIFGIGRQAPQIRLSQLKFRLLMMMGLLMKVWRLISTPCQAVKA